MRKSWTAIVLLGVAGMAMLGYAALYMVNSNPLVNYLLEIRRAVLEEYDLTQAQISLTVEGRLNGIYFTYAPGKDLASLSDDEQMYKLGQSIFSKARDIRLRQMRARSRRVMSVHFIVFEKVDPADVKKVLVKKELSSSDVMWYYLRFKRLETLEKKMAKMVPQGKVTIDLKPYDKGWTGDLEVEVDAEKVKVENSREARTLAYKYLQGAIDSHRRFKRNAKNISLTLKFAADKIPPVKVTFPASPGKNKKASKGKKKKKPVNDTKNSKQSKKKETHQQK